MGHVSTEHRGVGPAALYKFAVMIALTGRGALGLGMAKQHEAAHCGNVAFPT
jgi:hypothetical protein